MPWRAAGPPPRERNRAREVIKRVWVFQGSRYSTVTDVDSCTVSRPLLPKLELHSIMNAFTELRARNNAGDEVSFDAFAGKVVLVVNVARL